MKCKEVRFQNSYIGKKKKKCQEVSFQNSYFEKKKRIKIVCKIMWGLTCFQNSYIEKIKCKGFKFLTLKKKM